MTNAQIIPDHCVHLDPTPESAATPMTSAHHQYHAYPHPTQCLFQIQTITHTGGLMFWFNQRRVIRGTYAQCDAALRNAQTHNLTLGWWSLLSILIMNWVALASNSSARKQLDHDAQAYAQWWQTYCAPHVTPAAHWPTPASTR